MVLILPWISQLSGTIDDHRKIAWSPNTGWISFSHGQGEVAVHFNGNNGWLSGYAWGENIGWLAMGSAGGGPYENLSVSDWGVNFDADGNMSGFAWGENIGWIHFNPVYGGVRLDRATGGFQGKAWSENTGWLLFGGENPLYGVRTTAFDTQALGTPNWWLTLHEVREDDTNAAGIPAWQAFIMDIPPDATTPFRIMNIQQPSPEAVVSFGPVSPKRKYTLQRKTDLNEPEWFTIAELPAPQHHGPTASLPDASPPPRAFYRVTVSLPAQNP